MSEDATYEDMVAYSKDIWNAALAIGAVKNIGSAVKGKGGSLEAGTESLIEEVEESVIKGSNSSIIFSYRRRIKW